MKWGILTLGIVLILFVFWLFRSFFGIGGEDHGFYLVDGERDKELLISLRNSSSPDDQLSGEGKRIEALNRTHNELIYQDPDKRRWIVPKNTVNDGASVPPFLESIVAGGLNTDARYAAIVHDFYCDEMKRDDTSVAGGYPAIHRMFFHGMRCSHVPPRTAGLMYAAVAKFGPPSDRSFWARLVTQALPDESSVAGSDKEHSYAVWMSEGEIIREEADVALLSRNFPKEIQKAEKELDDAMVVQDLLVESSVRIQMEHARLIENSAVLLSNPDGNPSGSEGVPVTMLRELSERQREFESGRQRSREDLTLAQEKLMSLQKEFADERMENDRVITRARSDLQRIEDLLAHLPEEEISPDVIDQLLTNP